MGPEAYEQQDSWRKIQKFLPQSLHFDNVNHPEEEWWEHGGHTIHLDRWRNPQAKLRIILHHGVGTNGRQMSMILGVPLHKSGYEAVAIDMPNYGMTKNAPGKIVGYNDWVSIADAFINKELADDPRPIVLYGLSAGGMLTYHAAAANGKVKGIIGMTFLDQRIPQVRDETCRNILISRIGLPVTQIFAKIPLLAAISMPMWLASKMWALVNNPQALKIFLEDKTSAGSWSTMHFLSTYSNYKPAIEPENFALCPILLTQPSKDNWTPRHLSELFLGRINKVSVEIVELENAGHYPLEQPGLQQMIDAILGFLRKIELQQ